MAEGDDGVAARFLAVWRVGGECDKELLEDLCRCRLRLLPGPAQFAPQGGKGADGRWGIAVGFGQVAVDSAIEPALFHIPTNGRYRLLCRGGEGFGDQMLLVAKVPIEPAVRQAGGRHHVCETRLRDSSAPDQIRSGRHDGFAGLCGFQIRLSQCPILSDRPRRPP